MSGFVHLSCHTEYSLLEGAIRVSKLVNTAKEMGMSSIAITDNAAMYGAIEFYLKAKDAGINPIIGCELFLAEDMTVKERSRDRLILLAKNFKGYQHLIEIVSKAHLDGFYYRARIDLEHIEPFKDHLIAISPGFNGPVAQALQKHQTESAKAHAQRLKAMFGDDFYLGIQRCGLPFEDMVIQESKKLSQELGIGLVATNDVYYLKKDDANLRDVLACIQTGRKLDSLSRFGSESQEHYLKSADEMAQIFSDCPEAVQNTEVIAKKCNIEIETGQVMLPEFECPDGLSGEAYLEKLVWEGVNRKYPEITQEIKDRVKFELGIINKMHYAFYFLIIYDFLHFCHTNDIPVGPGRGSAAGSIVAYALDITKIDPIAYKLLFERFLNPERVSMPDVDIDFCIRRRGEVIDYIVRKYGEERVSQIITFGTMQSRAVVRDVGRVLDVELSDVDRMAKLIPSSPGHSVSVKEALEEIPDLKAMYEGPSEYKQLLDFAMQLEGQARHTSTHAAGVVISRDPLTTVVPLVKNDGQVATQYPMADIEKIGLLKMDILGLRNLTVMKDAVTMINRRHQLDLKLDELEYTDEKTYDLLCTGNTAGVFQLESSGMRALIKDLKPRVFEDVIALLALYRPGPLGSGMVSDFVSNKSGKTQVKYELDELEPILKDTYGMIVYQEQVMQIASTIGGFSLGEADVLRRAMGKKKKSEMDRMKDLFLKGADEKGFPSQKAKDIFELCYKFAEYGFNKSHSAAYALISYQTAYLKANYTIEYMAALLSSVLSSSEKTSLYIQDCQSMGIDVLGPSVNQSMVDFSIDDTQEKKAIRFGLGAIKNVGEGAILSIIENRKNGEYKSLWDLCTKVDLRQVNKRVLESLIKSGAMDDFGERSYLLAIYERLMERAQVAAKEQSNGQTGLFSEETTGVSMPMADIENQDYVMLSSQEKLRMEKELIGLYISGHPLDSLREKLDKMEFSTNKLTVNDQDKAVTLTGLLTQTRKVLTKTKKEMLIGELEDFYGSVTILVFSYRNFEKIAENFIEDAIVTVSGKVNVKNDEVSIHAEMVQILDSDHLKKQVVVDAGELDLPTLEKVKEISIKYRGNVPLYFKVGDVMIEAHKKYWLKDDPLCVSQLESLIGLGRVWRHH